MDRERDVSLTEAAIDDLFLVFLYLAERIGSEPAKAYTSRIEAFCHSLSRFSERGRRRDDLGDGMRSIVFESQAVIIYRIEGDGLTVQRVVHGAQNYGPDIII